MFDGSATAPYPEDAPLAPRSAYGRSKAAGEAAVRALLPDASYIVRTAWLYGEHGPNFVRTMVNLEASRDVLDVVDDQHGQPTWTRDVAASAPRWCARDAPAGTYHATLGGADDLVRPRQGRVRGARRRPGRVRPTTTDRFPRPAPRPAYSVLGHDGVAPGGDLADRRLAGAAERRRSRRCGVR